MVAIATSVVLLVMSCSLDHSEAYQIYNVDDPKVCNNTIWLDQGPKSAAILRLTSQPAYDLTPRYCTVTFRAPMHKWSGLLGVLENLDLRRYDDMQHHQGRSVCIDYVTITSPSQDSERRVMGRSASQQEHCGSWSINPWDEWAVIGHCPEDTKQCEPVRDLQVQVMIGREHKQQYLWANQAKSRNRGFTFVVTAYSFSYGVNECANDLQSCGIFNKRNTPFCIHDSLFCDGHINCGQMQRQIISLDERSCRKPDIYSSLLAMFTGPWMGTGFLVMMVLLILISTRKLKMMRTDADRQMLQQQLQTLAAPTQEINSYAESYEVSSNLSSAHHMAIQVRVVCNSGGQNWSGGTQCGTGSSAMGTAPWKPDMPPSYEVLFPHGPPEDVSNVPPQTHSPQFAHQACAAAAALGGENGRHSSSLSEVNCMQMQPMAEGNAHTIVTELTARTAGASLTQHQQQFNNRLFNSSSPSGPSNFREDDELHHQFGCSQSLDRRIPIRREISRSSLLNHGIRCNNPMIDASRLTLSSDPPSSPPSYDSENYTVVSPRTYNNCPRTEHLDPMMLLSNAQNHPLQESNSQIHHQDHFSTSPRDHSPMYQRDQSPTYQQDYLTFNPSDNNCRFNHNDQSGISQHQSLYQQDCTPADTQRRCAMHQQD